MPACRQINRDRYHLLLALHKAINDICPYLKIYSLVYVPNKLYTIKSPSIAIASAKTKARIIASIIFGAAEGFLPSALTLEYPTAAITPAGPNVVISIIKIIVNLFISY